MTKISKETVVCPRCEYWEAFMKYDSVNVTLNPKLRNKVMSGSIFDWTCPECGEKLSVRYNLLYHDMDKAFQVYYAPKSCTETNEMVNKLHAKYPSIRTLCRTVGTLNELREKILIFENGLNDIAIELIKIVVKYDKENNIPEECELRFEKIIKDKHLIFRRIINDEPQEGFILFAKTNYDNFLNEVTTNKKFKMTQYCDTIDEKWIVEHM